MQPLSYGVADGSLMVAVFLMAVYFAGLLAMRRSHGLSAWLHPDKAMPTQPSKEEGDALVGGREDAAVVSPRSLKGRRLLPAVLSVVCTGLSFAIGWAGQAAESRLRLLGSSASIITAASLLCWGGLLRLSSSSQLVSSLVSWVTPLSALLFNLFFGSIGAGATPGPLVAAGPAVLGLMSVTLAVHLSTCLLAMRALNRLLLRRRGPQEGGSGGGVGMEELIVASNANIGGPATAAALAGAINRPDLVLPATAMGTVGYALATGLGVGLFKLLLLLTGAKAGLP